MNFTDQRKGQSAIEFLMDYGWMLLVVAVIGAALFTYIQGMGDIQSVSGLNNRDIQVEDFSVNEQGLKAELRSVSADEINNLSLSLIDEDTGEIVYSDEVVGIAPAGTNITEISAAELSDNTRTYRVRATYDVGELENISSEGSITGRIAFNKTVEKKKEEEPVKTNIKASFDMNDSSPFDLGTTVKFNASESSPSSDIEAYEWDFDGDGAVDRVGKTVNYEFSEIGERQINLTVEASSGGYARESKTVEVVSGDETVVSDSLQERIDAADPGDTLYVENGTYTGINVPKELSIYGEEGATIAGRSYIQAANVSIRGFRINDRLDVDADSFDLKDSSIDSRDASNWGIVVDRDDLELKNVDIKAAKGAIALQNNIKGADLDLVDAETESSGRPALRLQNNVEASVEGGSFESNGGRALYTDGGNSDLTLSSNPSFKTSGWAFSIDRSTDLDVNGTLDVEEGKGSVNMMSIAAESGDKIRLEEGKVVNGAQEVAVNVPEPDLRDRYGYPIENPTKKYYPTNLAADNSVLTVKEGEKVELRYARVYGENMTLRDLEVRPTSGNYGIETMADSITLKNITVDQPRTWAIVNRNDGLLIEDSKISGQRGVHTDGVSGVTIKDSIIDSGRHGIRPKGGAKDILLEGNRFSVDNNVVNGDGNGIEVRMEDNIVERSNNVVSASDSSFEIINNTLNAQYSALPSGSGLDITLGTENIVEKGEFLSGVVSQADVGGSVDVTGEKVEILGKDVLVDISDIDHAKGTAHLRTKDVSISLTDKAPEFDVLRFHKDDISVEGMDIDTTRGKYAIETYSDGVVLEDIDLHNPNDYGIVNRGNNITLRDSRIDSRKEFYTDGGTSGHVIRNNTLISTNSLGFRPNGQITGFKIIDNYFKSNQNGISLKSGSEGEIRDNIFNVGSTAVSIPDNNDVDLGVNTIEKGIGTTVTSLDSVSERGEQIKITNTSAFVAGSNHRFEFVGGAAQESLGAIDLKTEGLLLNFTEPVEVSTGDRAIDVLGDNITVRNAYLTGSHGIEFHGNDGKITGSTMDVNNWGVLTRNDNNVVRGSHIVAEDGVHTNNNLNDIVVEDNVIQARQYGIRAKSGTTGEALNNRIDAGTPLQTADMDTSGNEIGSIQLGVSVESGALEKGQNVEFTSDIPDQFEVSESVWEFGDASEFGEGEETTHSYRLSGNFTAKLSVETRHGITYENTETIWINEKDSDRFDGSETLIEDSEDLQTVLDNADAGERFRLQEGSYDSFSLSVEGVEIVAEEGAEINGESTINSDNVRLQNVVHNGRLNIKGLNAVVNRSRFISDGNWGIVTRTSGAQVSQTHIDAQKGLYMDNNVELSLDKSSVLADRNALRVKSGAALNSSDNNIRGNNAVDANGEVNLEGDVLTGDGNVFGSTSRSIDFDGSITVNRGNILKPATLFAGENQEVTLRDGRIDYSDGRTIHTSIDTYGGGDTNLYTENATIISDGSARLSGDRFYLKDQGMELAEISSDARIEPEGRDITLRDMRIKDENNWGVVLRDSGAEFDNLAIEGHRGIYIDNSLSGLELADIDMDVDDKGLRIGDGSSGIDVSDSSLNSSSSYAVYAKSISDTNFSGLELSSPGSAISAQSNAELGLENITVLRGEILDGVDRASSPGDEIIVNEDSIENRGTGFTVDWKPEIHPQASIYTDDITVSTVGDASIRALNIYGDRTLIEDANLTQVSNGNRINVRGNDVTFRDASIKNVNDWAIVQRNPGLTLENVVIENDSQRGVYFDSGTEGHEVLNSSITVDRRGLYGQASTTLSVKDSTVASPDTAIRKDNGGELSLDNVVLSSPGGRALSVHSNVQLDLSELDVNGGGENSLTDFLIASPEGTETVVNGSTVSNEADGFTVDTETDEYDHLTIYTNDNVVNVSNDTVISTVKIKGNNNQIQGGRYYTDNNDHSFRVQGQDNTIRDAEIRNRYSWAFVIRRDGTSVENIDMQSQKGVYVDNNLNDNTVTDNIVNVDNNNGIYFKSGSGGLIADNLIINGNPAISPADADTESNTIEE